MWNELAKRGPVGLDFSAEKYDPSRPTLIMIHGSGGNKDLFRGQLHLLAGEINAIALDLPGHGDTPGPGCEHIGDYSDWLIELLDGWPIKPVLLGHSLGGAVSIDTALKRPDLLRGLVLVGTGARLRVMPDFLAGMRKDFAGAVAAMIPFAYGKEADPRLVELGVEQMASLDPALPLGDFTACDRFDVSGRVGDITLSTLILVGSGDNLTPVKYSQFLADKIRGSQLSIIDDAGHMSYLEKPRAFAELLLEFMGRF